MYIVLHHCPNKSIHSIFQPSTAFHAPPSGTQRDKEGFDTRDSIHCYDIPWNCGIDRVIAEVNINGTRHSPLISVELIAVMQYLKSNLLTVQHFGTIVHRFEEACTAADSCPSRWSSVPDIGEPYEYLSIAVGALEVHGHDLKANRRYAHHSTANRKELPNRSGLQCTNLCER